MYLKIMFEEFSYMPVGILTLARACNIYGMGTKPCSQCLHPPRPPPCSAHTKSAYKCLRGNAWGHDSRQTGMPHKPYGTWRSKHPTRAACHVSLNDGDPVIAKERTPETVHPRMKHDNGRSFLQGGNTGRQQAQDRGPRPLRQAFPLFDGILHRVV